MQRRLLIAAMIAITALAGPLTAAAAPPAPALPLTPEDRVLIDEASTYLDGLGQMHGHFLQTDARGTVSQGEIYLDRPGKARFDYQPPASLVVVSDGHAVLVYDRRLKTFYRYPLGSTPLALFLERHVRLDEKVVVTRIDRFAGGFALTLRDGKRQAQGQVELTFGDAPMALRQWTITYAQGARTTIRISDLEPVASLDPGLFVLQNPNRR